jgi:hypothetical protein
MFVYFDVIVDQVFSSLHSTPLMYLFLFSFFFCRQFLLVYFRLESFDSTLDLAGDLSTTMKNTELEIREGMRLHREMQSRQARQIAKYAGGLARSIRGGSGDASGDPNDSMPMMLRTHDGDEDSAVDLAQATLTSRRSSLNWNFDNGGVFVPIDDNLQHPTSIQIHSRRTSFNSGSVGIHPALGHPGASAAEGTQFLDYIPPLADELDIAIGGGESGAGEDEGDLFDFLFD